MTSHCMTLVYAPSAVGEYKLRIMVRGRKRALPRQTLTRVVHSMSELQRTPLRDFHAAHGARLVDFAGWEMPVQYRSILEEHKGVRRAAGMFDVSHMGEVDVRGPEAAKFLNHLVTNDVAKLFPGRVLYSPMCYPHGGVLATSPKISLGFANRLRRLPSRSRIGVRTTRYWRFKGPRRLKSCRL